MSKSDFQLPAQTKWNRRRISTVVAVGFWIWFLGSLFLVKRYPWVDTVWLAVWIALLVVGAIWTTIQRFGIQKFRIQRFSRGSDATNVVGYRGTPRWLATLFNDGINADGINEKDKAPHRDPQENN